MNIIDIAIWLLFIAGFFIGFKNGFLKQITNLLAFILTVVLAFLTKGFLADLMFRFMPFFEFSGVTSLNIILYETIAFLIMGIIYWSIIRLILKVIGVLDKIIKATVILNLPLKLLGAVVGFVEYYVIVFFLLFIFIQPQLATSLLVSESPTADAILNKSPMTGLINDKVVAFEKISEITKDLTVNDIDNANYQIVDLLLETKYVSIQTIEYLNNNEKIKIPNVNNLVNKYSNGGN